MQPSCRRRETECVIDLVRRARTQPSATVCANACARTDERRMTLTCFPQDCASYGRPPLGRRQTISGIKPGEDIVVQTRLRVLELCSLSLLVTLATTTLRADEPVVPAGAEVKKLAGGFQFVEGPVWDRKETLYFSDIPNSTLHQWAEKDGVTVFRKIEGSCNGLRIDADGNLFVCQPGGRKVVRIAPDGKQTTIADTFGGKKLNSPNDIWIAPDGGIYFTDPRYGNMDDLEQDGFHVYYLPVDGKLIRILDNLKKPNGVVGSPDGKKLYVTDPGANTTYVYDIQADGSLANRKVAADSGSDGLALDERGNLYITGKTIRIYSPDAKIVGQIELPESAANLTFGGKDGKTLFITARTSLYAVKLNVRGADDPFAK